MRSPHLVRVVAVGLSTLFAVLVAGTALGHAELDTMTPADKSTVPPPIEIVATFTEDLDPAGSSLVVVDPTGSVIARGGNVSKASPRVMRMGAPGTTAGTYTIRWTSKSADDGDLDRGTTTFTVVETGPTPICTDGCGGNSTDEPPSASPPPSAVAPSVTAESVTPSTAPSASPTTPAASSTDAVIPVVVALIVLAGLGLWLLRGRSRSSR